MVGASSTVFSAGELSSGNLMEGSVADWSKRRNTVPIAGSPGRAPGFFRKLRSGAVRGSSEGSNSRTASQSNAAFAGIGPATTGERMQ